MSLSLRATAFALMVAALPVLPATGGYIPDGYWVDRANKGDLYDGYLRIKDSSGFYCVLDGKSSHRFTLLDGRMDGYDTVRYFPGSGDVQIDGEEKGVKYTNRFRSIGVKDYPKYCVDREAADYPDGIAKNTASAKAMDPASHAAVDALGRKLISPSPLYPAAATGALGDRSP
jgi:hypothetical protein